MNSTGLHSPKHINHGGRLAVEVRALVCVAILAGVCQPSVAWSKPPSPAALTLDLTPRAPGSDGGSAGIAVSYTLNGTSGENEPITLRFDTLEPALLRQTDQVTALQVTDAKGAVAFEAPRRDNAQGRIWQVWTSSRPAQGPVHVSYFVPVAPPLPAKRGPHRDLQAAGGGVSGSLVSVLLLPQMSMPIDLELHWHLPSGQHAVSTLAFGDVHARTDMDQLEQTSFLAGPLQTFPNPPPTHGFSMYALGESGESLAKASAWSSKAYEAERQAFKASSSDAFRVMIRSYDGGPINSGTASSNAFLLYLPPSIKPDSPANRQLIAHEMVHAFAGGLKNDDRSHGDWYTEGLADYASTTLPFDAHLYSLSEYLTEVNRRAAQYYTNVHREASVDEAASLKWMGNGAWMLLYSRGALYFANLDAQLKAHGSKLRVVDLANAMSEQMKDGAPATAQTWIALLKSEVGEWAVADWTAMRDGKLLHPAPGAFGECVEAEPVKTGFYDLGFSWLDTDKGSFVKAVEPGSHAEAAGLRSGDEVAKVDLIPQLSSFDLPVQLSVTRNGSHLNVTYDPHSDAKVDAFRWKRREGTDAKECL